MATLTFVCKQPSKEKQRKHFNHQDAASKILELYTKIEPTLNSIKQACETKFSNIGLTVEWDKLSEEDDQEYVSYWAKDSWENQEYVSYWAEDSWENEARQEKVWHFVLGINAISEEIGDEEIDYVVEAHERLNHERTSVGVLVHEYLYDADWSGVKPCLDKNNQCYVEVKFVNIKIDENDDYTEGVTYL